MSAGLSAQGQLQVLENMLDFGMNPVTGTDQLVKGGRLSRQWGPDAVGLHRAVKAMFDPEGLLNPGKKLA